METKPETENSAAETPAAETPAAKPPKKKSLMRRIIKGLLWTIGGLLIFIILALLTLPLWINPVGTSLAGMIVPGYTDTAFNIERLNLNPYTGKLLVSGVRLANPEGYAEKDAFALGSLSVDLDVSSLMSKEIHVRDITIDAPYVSYVFDAAGSNNFDRILAAVNKKLGPKEKKEKEPSETKVVIDKVTIKNVKAAVNTGRFELTSLVVTDFGKSTAATIKLEGAKLVNPEGFPEPDAFSLKALSIGMETADLSKKPVVFHDIIVDTTYAGLVYNDAGEGNFDVILKPIKGDGKDEKKEVASDEKKDKEKEAKDDTPRVQIDKLDITGTKLQWRKVTLPIPLPTFTDIGKTTEKGATLKEVADQVMSKAKDAMTGFGDLAGAFGSGVTNVLGNAGGLVSGGVSNVLGGASNVLGGATSAISGGTSNVLSNAKGLIGNVLPGGENKEKKEDDAPGVADKAVEGAKNAGKAIGEGAVNAGKAIGEGAKNLGEGALKTLGIGK